MPPVVEGLMLRLVGQAMEELLAQVLGQAIPQTMGQLLAQLLEEVIGETIPQLMEELMPQLMEELIDPPGVWAKTRPRQPTRRPARKRGLTVAVTGLSSLPMEDGFSPALTEGR